MKRAGLENDFRKHARYDAEAFTLADKKFKCYVKQDRTTEETGHGRPEIDRARLRDILLESLPEDCIQWDRQVQSVSSDLTIHFVDGITASGFDLIVGADGAWSKVRPLLTDVRPSYSGISGLDLTLSDVAERAPQLDAIVNHGSMMAYTDGKSIVAQHTGAGALRIYAFARERQGWPGPIHGTGGLDTRDPPALRAGLLEYYADWDPQLRQFLTTFDDDKIRHWSLDQLPVDHTWSHRPGVTLIGDAAHLMTPFAGEGVNQAMADAMDLAARIIGAARGESDLDVAVRQYEEAMFPRAHAVMQETDDNKNQFFTRAPPSEWMPKFAAMMAGGGEAGGP